MVRKARIPSLTGYYHILVQGNNKEHIFKNDVDKGFYLLYLKECTIRNDVELASWCMLDNNAHFLLHAKLDKLSELMRQVNTKYATLYNKKYSRVGHVFRGRFKCKNIEHDDYLLKVIRYIHNRPLDKKLVTRAYRYKWSSYKEYIIEEPKYIHNNQMNIIFNNFNSDTELFKAYHATKDYDKYLDIYDINSKEQVIIADKIIKDFCEKHRISDLNNIYGQPVLMKDLVAELLFTGKLSNRKIASLVGISNYYVKKVQNYLKLI